MTQPDPVSLFVLVISSRQYEREIHLYETFNLEGMYFISFVSFPCNGEQSSEEGNLQVRCAPLSPLQLQRETNRMVDTSFHDKQPTLLRSDFPPVISYHL